MNAPTVEEITAAVADHFGISVDVLTGPGRGRVDTSRRAVAYCLCAEFTETSLLQIGRSFGGRDQTSVQCGLAKPLDLIHEAALDCLRTAFSHRTDHAREVVARWPFKSRRKPVKPMFIRRYTA